MSSILTNLHLCGSASPQQRTELPDIGDAFQVQNLFNQCRTFRASQDWPDEIRRLGYNLGPRHGIPGRAANIVNAPADMSAIG
jgi:hypothetical protein